MPNIAMLTPDPRKANYNMAMGATTTDYTTGIEHS